MWGLFHKPRHKDHVIKQQGFNRTHLTQNSGIESHKSRRACTQWPLRKMDPFTQRNIQPYWKWDQIVENNWKIPLIFMVITKYNHHLNSQILHNYPWLLYQTTWGVCFCMLLKFNQGAVARLAFLYDMAKSSLRHILRPRTFSVPTTLGSNQNSPFFAKLQDFRMFGVHSQRIHGTGIFTYIDPIKVNWM